MRALLNRIFHHSPNAPRSDPAGANAEFDRTVIKGVLQLILPPEEHHLVHLLNEAANYRNFAMRAPYIARHIEAQLRQTGQQRADIIDVELFCKLVAANLAHLDQMASVYCLFEFAGRRHEVPKLHSGFFDPKSDSG